MLAPQTDCHHILVRVILLFLRFEELRKLIMKRTHETIESAEALRKELANNEAVRRPLLFEFRLSLSP